MLFVVPADGAIYLDWSFSRTKDLYWYVICIIESIIQLLVVVGEGEDCGENVLSANIVQRYRSDLQTHTLRVCTEQIIVPTLCVQLIGSNWKSGPLLPIF